MKIINLNPLCLEVSKNKSPIPENVLEQRYLVSEGKES